MISESEEEFDQKKEYSEEDDTGEEKVEDSITTPSEVQATVTRYGDISPMPEMYQHLQAKAENSEEYTMDNERILAKTICHVTNNSSKSLV